MKHRWTVVGVTVCVVSAIGCSRYEPIEVGSCLPSGTGVVGVRAQSPDTVPCTAEHRFQAYARRDLTPPGDEWPGAELVELNARRLCGVAVPDAAGVEPADLPDGVTIVQVAPTESSWRGGDREVECLFRWDADTRDTLVPPSKPDPD